MVQNRRIQKGKTNNILRNSNNNCKRSNIRDSKDVPNVWCDDMGAIHSDEKGFDQQNSEENWSKIIAVALIFLAMGITIGSYMTENSIMSAVRSGEIYTITKTVCIGMMQ